MKIVTPEQWYIAFWILGGVVFLVALFFVIRSAVISALTAKGL